MPNQIIIAPAYVAEIERDPRLKSTHTRRQYRAALGAFEEWRAERPMTKTLVEEYAAHLQREGKAPATIKQTVAVIKWWCRRCIDLAREQLPREEAERFEYLVSRILTIEEKTVAKGSREIAGRHIETDEIKSLLNACKADSTPKGPRDAAMIAVAVGSVCRNEELRNLTIEDITYTKEGADVLIRHGKGDKTRITHLHNGSIAALNAWLDVRGVDAGPIFCPILKSGKIITGHGISYEGTRKVLKNRFLQSALSERTTWHDFRRTGVGALFDSGADISTIQGIAGHASPNTTSKYDRRPQNRRREALKAIDVPF